MAPLSSPRSKCNTSRFWFLVAVLLVLVCLCPPLACAKPNEGDQDVVIGIDLGTTYSRVAVKREGQLEVIVDDDGHGAIPSWVSLTKDGNLIVEDTSQSLYHLKDQHSVFDMKRLMGQNVNYVDNALRQNHGPIQVVSDNHRLKVRIQHTAQTKTYLPEEITAVVLARLKEKAESYLGRKITHAVVTVPAYFNDAQRMATKDAGRLAGLTILRVINEPTAAAIAHGLDKIQTLDRESLLIVYDFGGGTLDVSLLSIDDGVFEILGTAGESHLGGDDINSLLIDHFATIYKERMGNDIAKGGEAFRSLEREVENLKRTLTSQISARLELGPFDGNRKFEETLSRDKFETIIAPLLLKTLRPIEQVLQDAGKTPGEIDHIILAGGSSVIPKVQDLVKSFFNGKKPLRGVEPEEAVVRGAAIQGDILSGSDDNLGCLFGIFTPYSYGIETPDGVFTTMIPPNVILPSRKTNVFSAVVGDSTRLPLKIREERGELGKDGRIVGEIVLTYATIAERNEAQIEVSIEIDESGALRASAVDKASGNSASIQLNVRWPWHEPLSQDEIDRMVHEAEQFAKEDEARQKSLQSLNRLQNRINSLRSEVLESSGIGYTLRENDRQVIRAALQDTMGWVDEHSGATAEVFDDRLADLNAMVESMSVLTVAVETPNAHIEL